jgi:hypothetical protein
MYKSEHTQHAINVLQRAAEYLEWLNEANSHISGNGKDTVLECFSRIATCEPDNPLYPAASAKVFNLSFCLHEMRNELLDVMDTVYGTASHFKVFDSDAGEWFHDNNSTAESHFMQQLEVEQAS